MAEEKRPNLMPMEEEDFLQAGMGGYFERVTDLILSRALLIGYDWKVLAGCGPSTDHSSTTS
jgi:hypothetical protein